MSGSARHSRPVRDGRRIPVAALTAVACLVAAVLPALPAQAQAEPNARGGRDTITVVGTGHARKDVKNINKAIAKAGNNGKTVQLIGHFNMGDTCIACVRISNPVTIVGTGDPTVANPDEASTTIIEGGPNGLASVPFLVFEPGAGEVNISRLWFRNMLEGQLWLEGTSADTKVRFSYNRFTELRPSFTPSLSFPMAGGWSIEKMNTEQNERGSIADVSPAGEWQVDHNYADVIRHPFFGDQDCVAMAHWSFSKVTITDNVLKCDQDVVEVEGGLNPDARVLVARNQLEMSAAPSPEGIAYPPGGHPEGLKIMANLAASIQVVDNQVLANGTDSDKGVCILFASPQGQPPSFGSNLLAGNTCTMDNMTAGLLAGYTQGGAFYPAGTMQNTLVVNNTFTGTAKFGIAFLDYEPPLGLGREWGLTNDGNGNVFANNDLSGVVAPVALQFGPATHDNLFVGDPSGPVVDDGTNNVVIP